MKKLQLKRLLDSGEETVGILYLIENNVKTFLCFTLEDEYRNVKVKHETRIPEGVYKLNLRTFGRLHEKYLGRFPEFHKGMIELRSVPNFDAILIHIGNTDGDTSGCVLVGRYAFEVKKRWRLMDSTTAYKSLYNTIVPLLINKEDIYLEIADKDREAL
jgi:hypothetical protein